jgi:hypothetical protein
VGLEFSRENGVVFAARNCVESQISDLDQLARELKRRYYEGAFPGHYVVVTTVVSAKSATILISRSREGAITLRANANVPIGDLLDLASVEAKFSATRSRNLSSQYVAESDLTPLFKVVGFERKWWSGEPKNGLEELGGDEDSELREASFDDYVRSR